MRVMITGFENKLSKYDQSIFDMGVLPGEVYDVDSFELHKHESGELISLPTITSKRGETLYLNVGEFKEVI